MRLDRIRLAVLGAALAFSALSPIPARADAPPVEMTAEQQAYLVKMQGILKSLHPQHDDVPIAGAKATLHLGKAYYFLNAEESRKVIVDGWGNPPEQAEGVLGMVFPEGKVFFDPQTWGAVITYEEQGHVADDDAASADYEELLGQLRAGEEERNKARQEKGYPPAHLVGWAERPSYDRTSHSVVWARNLQVGDEADHSLNYDVRLLGRNGVLSLNMISTMSHLGEMKTAAASFARTARFDTNFAYTDYVEGVDKAAGYGIAGLVAAGAGVLAVKKLGFLAIVLGFGKKIILLVAVAGAALWRWIRKLFVRRPESEAYAAIESDAPVAETALSPPAADEGQGTALPES